MSNDTPQEKLNALAADLTDGAGAAILREVARLQSDNLDLKARLLRIWSLAGVLALMFLLFVGAFIWIYPKYRYIPTTDNNAICEVGTNSEARVTPATLTDFAGDAVVNAYTYDYVNYRETIDYVAARWFTENGRKAFLASLDESQNLERVKKGRFILRAMKINAAQIEEDGLINGTQKYWLVQVPIAIEFYVGGEDKPKSRQEFLAAVTIVQILPSATNLKGIAIDRIGLSPFIKK